MVGGMALHPTNYHRPRPPIIFFMVGHTSKIAIDAMCDFKNEWDIASLTGEGIIGIDPRIRPSDSPATSGPGIETLVVGEHPPQLHLEVGRWPGNDIAELAPGSGAPEASATTPLNLLNYPRKRCCCRIGREGFVVGKMAVCSLNISSVWTDSEFGNSIESGVTPLT